MHDKLQPTFYSRIKSSVDGASLQMLQFTIKISFHFYAHMHPDIYET